MGGQGRKQNLQSSIGFEWVTMKERICTAAATGLEFLKLKKAYRDLQAVSDSWYIKGHFV